MFADSWSAQSGGTLHQPKATDELFLVTPCQIEPMDPATGDPCRDDRSRGRELRERSARRARLGGKAAD